MYLESSQREVVLVKKAITLKADRVTFLGNLSTPSLFTMGQNNVHIK